MRKNQCAPIAPFFRRAFIEQMSGSAPVYRGWLVGEK